MGEVFLAEDLELGRHVALKVLPLVVADDAERVARFIQEARAASSLNHPNIITIHEVGTVNDMRFIATELIEGETLRDKIKKGSLTMFAIADISVQASLALQTAHSRDIIHRDIKPENIMVRHDGLVKVLDFGLAKLTHQNPFDSDSRAPTREFVKSRSGTILGTVAYMSPEQARGKKVDVRTDIFSLGSVIYEMLTGAKPFPGETSSDIIASILMKEPLSPRALNPDIPAEFESIVLKMLSKECDDRYRDVGSLLSDLTPLKRDLEVGSITNGGGSTAARAKTEMLVTDAGRTDGVDTSKVRDRASEPNPRSRLTEKLSSLLTFKTLALITVGVFALAALTFFLAVPGSVVAPKPEALALYNSGTDALRDGTYHKASKLLEDSIAIDGNFANARARLAEAWIELDYFGRAEREMLKVRELQRAQKGLFSSLSREDGDLYIDGVSATVLRNLPEAVRVYETVTKSTPDDPKAYLDLGRSLERNEEIDRAVESYEKAIQLNGQYGPAFLRLAILKSRRGDYENAFAAFDKAEAIYDRASNDEGVAEVKLYRGAALNAQDNLKSALEQFEHVSASPRANENQKIRAMLQTSSLLCSEGKTQPAQLLASQAIELARKERMENVATSGLIDLANAFSSREEYATAEQNLRQALDFAHQNEGRRNEARAALALASMYLAIHKADAALDFVKQALPFFEQGGYSREVSQAYVISGFASTMRGDVTQAVEAFEKASQIGEASQRALAITGIGTVLTEQEQHPRALQYFEQSNTLYEQMGNGYYTAFSKYNVAATLAKLGSLAGAKQRLAEAEKTLADLKISQPNLEDKFALLKAQIALSEGRFSDVPEITKRITISDDPESEAEVYRLTALSQALARPQSTEAVRAALKALETAERSKEPKEVYRSKLRLSEVYFITGNKKDALTTALEAKDYFVGAGQKESVWRAWLIAAKSSEGEVALDYLSSATRSLSELKQDWGPDHFQSYSARADIKFYLSQIDQSN